MSLDKILAHIKALTNLKWDKFVTFPTIKSSIEMLKEEIGNVLFLFQRHKVHLQLDSAQKVKAASTDKSRFPIPTAFRYSSTSVTLSSNEFHMQIYPASRIQPRRKPGKPGAYDMSIRKHLDAIVLTLRGREDYDPIFLTDDGTHSMGIDDFSRSAEEVFLTSNQRAEYRKLFRKALADGVTKEMCLFSH